MSLIELAERKARMRAFAFYGFAAAIQGLLLTTLGARPSPFFSGLWLGMSIAAILCLTPLATRLKANGPLARLLDDETTRDHRQASGTVGLWAAVTASLAMIVVTAAANTVSATDTARVILSAAVTGALLCFATLELRATR